MHVSLEIPVFRQISASRNTCTIGFSNNDALSSHNSLILKKKKNNGWREIQFHPNGLRPEGRKPKMGMETAKAYPCIMACFADIPRAVSYGVYIFHFIQFTRVTFHADLNTLEIKF